MKAKPVILIVDDEPQNIELLEAYLIPQGYEINKAANGEEALGKLSDNQIDLILLDVKMPGMDGFEVTRRIRKDNTHRLLPIIIVTTLQETEDRVKGIEAGCDDFISYPVDKIELLARVRSLLKVKAYNDLMSNYRTELESEVTMRTEELKHTLENLQQDITERKRVEEALVESEERTRTFLNSTSDMAFLKDENFRHIIANLALCKFYGKTESEIIGKTDFDLMTEKAAAECRKTDEKTLLSSALQISEEVIGSRHYETMKFPVKFEKGKNGIGAYIRDVTERNRAEEALRGK